MRNRATVAASGSAGWCWACSRPHGLRRPRQLRVAGLAGSKPSTAIGCCICKADPYEIGYQHGALLKEDVRENLHYLLEVKGTRPSRSDRCRSRREPRSSDRQDSRSGTSRRSTFDEMAGLAAAADLPLQDVRAANFIPELFHCSGFAVMNSATQDGTLYHGRVLDYAVDWQLQDHAVLIVCEPAGRDSVRQRQLRRLYRLGHRHERPARFDRRDGRPRTGPLGRAADGAVGARGAADRRRSGRGHRRVSRPAPHLPILLRHRRRQHESGGRHGSIVG